MDKSSIDLNRIHNCTNPHQDSRYKRVLCVCSAGLLRSPTAAVVLSNDPYNFNTRAVGLVESYALMPISAVHVYWAEEVVCMDNDQAEEIRKRFIDVMGSKEVVVLGIPDRFAYRDPDLVNLIKTNYDLYMKKER